MTDKKDQVQQPKPAEPTKPVVSQPTFERLSIKPPENTGNNQDSNKQNK